MIEAHTLDAWTRPADRASPALSATRSPRRLCGAAVSLAGRPRRWSWRPNAHSSGRRQPSRGDAGHRQARARDLHPRVPLPSAGLHRQPGQPAVTLFRVDILNVMGPAIVAAGLVWGCARRPRRARARLRGLGDCASRWSRRSFAIGGVGRTRCRSGCSGTSGRPGEHTTFTLFPWAGFVLRRRRVGALLLGLAPRYRAERGLQVALAAVGRRLWRSGSTRHPFRRIYRASSFWTSSPTYFAIRVGRHDAGACRASTASAAAGRAGLSYSALERLGP